MTTIVLIAFAVMLILLLSLSCYIAYRLEKKDFNNGICPKCGKPLKHFDSTFCGDQGWICDDCDYCVWISWFKK